MERDLHLLQEKTLDYKYNSNDSLSVPSSMPDDLKELELFHFS